MPLQRTTEAGPNPVPKTVSGMLVPSLGWVGLTLVTVGAGYGIVALIDRCCEGPGGPSFVVARVTVVPLGTELGTKMVIVAL